MVLTDPSDMSNETIQELFFLGISRQKNRVLLPNSNEFFSSLGIPKLT